LKASSTLQKKQVVIQDGIGNELARKMRAANANRKEGALTIN